jgi:hypothetical protein
MRRALPPPGTVLCAAAASIGGGVALGIDDYVAYWSCDEGEGSVVRDQAPEQCDGVIVGATWTDGVVGTGLAFDGANDFVVITDPHGEPGHVGDLTHGTISVWFRLDSAPPANVIHPILYLGDGVGPTQSGLIIEVGHFGFDTSGNNLKLYYTVFDEAGHIPLCFDSARQLDVGRWYHFAAVVGPGFNTGFLDGREMTERHYNFGDATREDFFASVTDQRVFWIGRGFLARRPADQFHHGAIDEIRIYDRPLDAQEIRAYRDAIAAGDADGDGTVDAADLLRVLGAWGPCEDCPEDFDGDGVVGVADLLAVLDRWE